MMMMMIVTPHQKPGHVLRTNNFQILSISTVSLSEEILVIRTFPMLFSILSLIFRFRFFFEFSKRLKREQNQISGICEFSQLLFFPKILADFMTQDMFIRSQTLPGSRPGLRKSEFPKNSIFQ